MDEWKNEWRKEGREGWMGEWVNRCVSGFVAGLEEPLEGRSYVGNGFVQFSVVWTDGEKPCYSKV